MTFLFIILCVVGIVVWTVTRKKTKNTKSVVRGGGGAPYTSTSQDNTTIKENTEF
jgi:uncharacterized iron-regulated membrane protein